MNRLASTVIGCLLVCAASCAKKEPKPMRTEPWLAHPSARASASGDAALPTTRYVLGNDSLIRFEIPTKRGALNGTITRVSGELNLDLSNLSQSRGVVRADLGSLEIHGGSDAEGSDSALLERARTALELTSDGGANAIATFTLTSVEDASPPLIEAAPEREGGIFGRRAHLTAVGDLLLHGFRVARRAPLSAEFGFAGDRQVPRSVLIRSRTPFVVSLETHAIVAMAAESRTKVPASAPAQLRETRVSVELYGTKLD